MQNAFFIVKYKLMLWRTKLELTSKNKTIIVLNIHLHFFFSLFKIFESLKEQKSKKIAINSILICFLNFYNLNTYCNKNNQNNTFLVEKEENHNLFNIVIRDFMSFLGHYGSLSAFFRAYFAIYMWIFLCFMGNSIRTIDIIIIIITIKY